jgi:thiol-disulfide isomerase/thioredoxin
MLKYEITSLRTKVDSLINFYQSLPEDKKQLQLKPVTDEVIEHINQYKETVGAFVMDNPRSFASYFALFLTLNDGNMVLNIMDKQDQVYFATIATSLDILYPKSPRVRQLYDMVLKAKSEQRKAQMIEIIANAEGSGLPEIKEHDLNGNEIALSSLKGKVVLLSFWASQDKASRRENQLLKPIYQKYKGKGFEVYQVGIERSRVLWESVLVQDEIPWISVSDLKYTESIAAKIYNVQQLPANYLISRDGQIIGKDLFGSRLEEKLKEVL